MSALQQLGVIRASLKKALGEHPRAPIPGRSDTKHPAITPQGALNVVRDLRPAIVRAVGPDDFEDIYAVEDPVSKQVRGEDPTQVNKIRAVAGFKRAELAARQANVPIAGSNFTEEIRGNAVLVGGLTATYWGGLSDAVLFGSALSAQVTFGEKWEAIMAGVREGTKNVGEAAGTVLEGAATAAGDITKSVFGGLLTGLGPLGLILVIGGLVYVATELGD